jgi:hypothetical protein
MADTSIKRFDREMWNTRSFAAGLNGIEGLRFIVAIILGSIF